MLIVVIGPPRSGVESVHRILQAWGVASDGLDTGDSLIALHDWLFDTLGGSWWDIPHLDPAWLPQSIVEAFRQRARTLIDAHRHVATWVLADPRMALVLPLWKPLLPPWRAVFAAGDVWSAAVSMQHDADSSFPLPHATALWAHYAASGLSSLAGMPMLAVDPEALVHRQPDALARLRDALAEIDIAIDTTSRQPTLDCPGCMAPPPWQADASCDALDRLLRAASAAPGWVDTPPVAPPDWLPPALIDLNRQRRIIVAPHRAEPTPVPGATRRFALRLPRQLFRRVEGLLHRAYYAIPLIPYPQKRRAILWAHGNLAWLTRHTESFYHFRRQWAELDDERVEPEHTTPRSATRPAPTTTISLVMPVYDTDPRWLAASIGSIVAQTYPHWELCIADDGSTRAETLGLLENLNHERIRVRRLDANRGIAAATNAALAVATGDYVGFMDHDDLLTPDALWQMAEAIERVHPDILYSDEDKVDDAGRLHDPHLKPDYCPDLLLAQNYISHFTVCRRELVESVGGLREGYDGAQDHELLLRLVERTDRVHHVPQVLYHWRQIPGSTALGLGEKSGAWAAGLRAVADTIERRGLAAEARFGPFGGTYSVRRQVQDAPRVSIIVPFRDQPEILEQCLDSILAATRYRHWELIGVDNHSRDPRIARLRERYRQRDARIRFIDYAVPFNYAQINNHAATLAQGEHLLLLNNDISVIDEDWLEILLAHSQRPEVGAVGCKLLYPDDTLQHAGIIVGLGGVAGHSHKNLPAAAGGYFSRPHLTHGVGAVTGACLMVKTGLYRASGGLDERRLRVAFNDVDFCLRLREAGYRNIYAAECVLYHHESKSRGYEDNPEKVARFNAEVEFMKRRHATTLAAGDPHYHPGLTLDGDSFSLRRPYTGTVEHAG